jgi:hypothetical protein
MKKSLLKIGAVGMIALSVLSCKKDYSPRECNEETQPLVKVFATGLNNPRGLKFGPDGYLYVAEGGVGGTNSTIGQCTQVPPPVGPFKGSATGGRISRISTVGTRTTVADELPSAVNALGDVIGAADVAFVGNSLYALITGGGCSHGVPEVPNSVVRINPGAPLTRIANLSAWYAANPVKSPAAGDFEPDGDWYSMISVGNNFYAVEANGGQVVKITTGGNISRVVDISASLGHVVPTSIVHYKGNFIVGNLNPFPIVPGSSSLYKITPAGEISVFATGFTTILGIAMDKHDRLYVLENTVGPPFPTPGTGRIVRLDHAGNKTVVITGLSLPTGLTIGKDGKLYVSNIGFGPESIGGGQVLQIDLCPCNKQEKEGEVER